MRQAEISLSTDQIAAFVELARQGSLRRAAQRLHISEQGVRERLIALEGKLQIELYRKSRGMRHTTPLTQQGRQFLPHAVAFLDRARELCEVAGSSPAEQEVHVAASQYLTLYVLADVIRSFHAAFPQIRIRLSTRTEQEIEEALLNHPEITVGVAAPYEPARQLEYRHLFSMPWSLIRPRTRRRGPRRDVRLQDLADEPLILFEHGSTGRQHVMAAFHGLGLSPRVEMEATNTEIIVRLVECGLGLSIVPLLPSGVVTRGRRVEVFPLREQIAPIHSGILTRRDEPLAAPSRQFVDFVVRELAPLRDVGKR